MLFAFISVVLLKAYAIGIVWRCYKFLTLQRQNLTSMLPYIIPDVGGGSTASHRLERDYSSLLPDYDEAIAQSMKQAPPPSYQVAMSVNGHVAMIPDEQEDQSVAARRTPPTAAVATIVVSGDGLEPSTSTQGTTNVVVVIPPPPYEEDNLPADTEEAARDAPQSIIPVNNPSPSSNVNAAIPAAIKSSS